MHLNSSSLLYSMCHVSEWFEKATTHKQMLQITIMHSAQCDTCMILIMPVQQQQMRKFTSRMSCLAVWAAVSCRGEGSFGILAYGSCGYTNL